MAPKLEEAMLDESLESTDTHFSMNRSTKVCVIGNGYVGLPLCVLMKDCGHTVTGLDANKGCVESHRQGKSTICDVDDDQLEGITFTSDAAETEDCEVHIICVPTPVTGNKMPNLRYITAVKQTLLKHAKPGSLIILESTVGVGDTRRVFKDMVGNGFRVAHSPKRIGPGPMFPTFQNGPKVVGGVNPDSTVAAHSFYSTVFTSVVPLRNSEHSEAVKLLGNSNRAVNIFLRASGMSRISIEMSQAPSRMATRLP